MRIAAGLLVAIALAGAGQASAIEVRTLEVREQGRRYIVEFDARLAAQPVAVMNVLTDFAVYPRLDTRILEARRAGIQDGKPLLYTRLRGCVGSVFCSVMERWEMLDEQPDRLIATAVPGRGDLRDGLTVTRLAPEGGGTRVLYRTEFDPSFWMPRWLVRSAMRTTLRDGTLGMFRAIETRAAAGSGG
ncbi:MAG: SRPBCC family protein [Steroidobacteraceae bacterium]